MTKPKTDAPIEEYSEHAPILSTWRNVYILVAGALLVTIILFYLFTLYFA
ncbi:hypothetical protein [Emticicia sp. C21]|nr:hypothetical protein [Emticicia sp. C21]